MTKARIVLGVVGLAVLVAAGASRRASPRVAVSPPVAGVAAAAPVLSAQDAFLLANAHRHGAGVPKDAAKALALYERAGQMGHAPALQTLALAYQYGELGLAPDEAESRRYAMEAEHAVEHAAEAVGGAGRP